MGRVVYSMSVSLDGFASTADGSLDWVHVDDELHQAFNDEARQMSASLYGRRMYELMTDLLADRGVRPGRAAGHP